MKKPVPIKKMLKQNHLSKRTRVNSSFSIQQTKKIMVAEVKIKPKVKRINETTMKKIGEMTEQQLSANAIKNKLIKEGIKLHHGEIKIAIKNYWENKGTTPKKPKRQTKLSVYRQTRKKNKIMPKKRFFDLISKSIPNQIKKYFSADKQNKLWKLYARNSVKIKYKIPAKNYIKIAVELFKQKNTKKPTAFIEIQKKLAEKKVSISLSGINVISTRLEIFSKEEKAMRKRFYFGNKTKIKIKPKTVSKEISIKISELVNMDYYPADVLAQLEKTGIKNEKILMEKINNLWSKRQKQLRIEKINKMNKMRFPTSKDF